MILSNFYYRQLNKQRLKTVNAKHIFLLIVTHSKGGLQLEPFLLHFSVNIPEYAFLCVRLEIIVRTSFHFKIGIDFGHILKHNKM